MKVPESIRFLLLAEPKPFSLEKFPLSRSVATFAIRSQGEFFFSRRGPRNSSPSLAERIDVQGDCWIWTGWRDENGYGRIQENGQVYRAHRFFYELLVGVIPPDLEIDHICKRTSCVNPDHCEPVDRATNAKRARGSTAERCKRGHVGQYTTYGSRPDNYRRCRACIAENNARYRV